MVWFHIKVAHIFPRNDAFLNLDEEMIAKAPIGDAKLNFKMTQDSLDRVYLEYQCDTFKIDNALVNQIRLMVFMDTDAHVNVKQ